MIVRELITKLGFSVDLEKIAALDKRIGDSKRNLDMMSGNLREVAVGVRNFGAVMTAAVSVPLALLGIKALKTASDFEQMDVAFTTMLGSAEKAKKFMADMQKFALQTPFEIKEVADNARVLLAMGIEAKKVIPTMEVLGNAAAGLSVPLWRIALNYGQVRTQTILTGAELRDFARAGVPLIAQLAKQLGVSEGEIKNMTSEGKISFEMVEKAFFDMSKEGGVFFDLMKKQSQTMGGRWSNFLDTLTFTLRELGELIDTAFNVKENITRLTTAIGLLRYMLKKLGPVGQTFIGWLGAMVITIPVVITLLGGLAAAVWAYKLSMVQLIPILNFFNIANLRALMGLAMAKSALLLAWWPYIAVIAAVGAALWLLIDDLAIWYRGGDSLIGAFFGKFKNFKDNLVGLFGQIKDAFSALFSALLTGNQSKWDEFKTTAWEAVKTIFKGLDKIMEGLGNMVIAVIPILLKSLWKLAWIILKVAAQILNGLMNMIANFIIISVKELFRLIPKMVSGLFEELGNLFPGAKKALVTTGNWLGGYQTADSARAAAMSGATSRTRVTENNINVKTDLVLQIPDGTPGAQQSFIENSARSMVRDELGLILSGALAGNPVVE